MKPVIVVYLSRLFYQMGDDSVREMTEALQSPDDQYHLFVTLSPDDNTTIDAFPKYVLVEDKETFQGLVNASDSLKEKVSKLNGVMLSFLQEPK